MEWTITAGPPTVGVLGDFGVATVAKIEMKKETSWKENILECVSNVMRWKE